MTNYRILCYANMNAMQKYLSVFPLKRLAVCFQFFSLFYLTTFSIKTIVKFLH